MVLIPILAATSHTPFYIVGGLLAVWAVILAAIGLSRPSFPGNDAVTRATIGVTVLLVVATLATALGTASTPTGDNEAAAKKEAAVPEQVGVAPPVTPPAAGAGGGAGSGGAAGPGGASGATAAAGKALFIGAGGCGACHVYAPAGSTGQIGPSLATIGKDDPAAAIKEAILSPNKEVVKGYTAGIMPNDYGTRLTPEQIDGLVAFLKSASK